MTPHDVYIASGTGGGSGTFANPYLANSAGRFDEILRGIADDAHIHIRRGTFFTRGLRHSIGKKDFGWDVRSGWTITGAGEGATILRLERWPDFIASADGPDQKREWAVMGCAPDAPVSGVVIAQLTVDGNWSRLPNRPASTETLPETIDPFVALHGIDCTRDGSITCRNVKVIGCYGKLDERPLEYGNPPQPRSPIADLSQPFSAVCVRSSSSSPPYPAASHSAPVLLIEHCTFIDAGNNGLTEAVLEK